MKQSFPKTKTKFAQHMPNKRLNYVNQQTTQVNKSGANNQGPYYNDRNTQYDQQYSQSAGSRWTGQNTFSGDGMNMYPGNKHVYNVPTSNMFTAAGN